VLVLGGGEGISTSVERLFLEEGRGGEGREVEGMGGEGISRSVECLF